jgi:hypothetical protein
LRKSASTLFRKAWLLSHRHKVAPTLFKQLVAEFETSGLRRSEFCHKHNLALRKLQRGLSRRWVEVEGQSEGKQLVGSVQNVLQKKERVMVSGWK